MKHLLGIFNQYRGLKKEIYVIFFSRLITALGVMVWPLMTLIMIGKLGYTQEEVGIIMALSSLIFLPASILGGYLADHIGRKKVIMIFDSLVVLSYFIAAIFPIGNFTLVLMIAAGVFSTLEDPSHTSMIADLSEPENRDRAYSLSYLGFNLGFIVGPAIGGFLFENHLSLVFLIDSLTTLLALILLIIFVPETKKIAEQAHEEEIHNVYEEKVEASTLKVIFSLKPVLIYFLLVIFGSIIYSQWGVTLTLYLESIYGEKAGEVLGVLYSFNGFVVIAFTAAVTYVFHKVEDIKKFMVGMFLQGFGFFLFIIDERYIVLFIAIFVFTIGEIVNTIASGPYLSKRIPLSHRGKINGLLPIMYTVGHTIAPLIATQVLKFIDFNTYWVYVFLFAILTSSLYYLLFIIDKKRFPLLYKSN